MRKTIITLTSSILVMLIACSKSNPAPETCLPAFDSIDGGSGKFISVTKSTTPEVIKIERRELISSQLKAGDNIYLNGTKLTIHSFWYDSTGLKGGIKVQYHDSLVGSHAFENDPLICWK
tara:strand:- start:153 stop:512 length:360 start_codon:yes stop_codon:yes gene_type:complete